MIGPGEPSLLLAPLEMKRKFSSPPFHNWKGLGVPPALPSVFSSHPPSHHQRPRIASQSHMLGAGGLPGIPACPAGPGNPRESDAALSSSDSRVLFSQRREAYLIFRFEKASALGLAIF